MRSLTARQKAALKDPSTVVAVFVELEHPDGTVYLWSGSGLIDHGGQQWLGCGQVGAVSGVEGSSDPRISRVQFVLSAVPGDALNIADVDLKGRQGIIYHAIMRADGTIIDGLLETDRADLDTQEVSAAADGTFIITINSQSGFWQLELPSNLFWSPEQQKIDHPGDTGMDALAELEDLQITWTAT